MISDLELAQAANDCYPDCLAGGGLWAQTWMTNDIHVGLRHATGGDIIAFRGSIDETDWLRDFEGWPRKHPKLGYCHSGFLENMDAVAIELSMAIGPEKPYAITGHSLGAARALILSAMMVLAKTPPALVVTFGTPRPGMGQLSDILRNGGFPIRHYKNGPDPVADVPVTIPPLWLYQKPVVDTALSMAPSEGALDPFHWHHMPLYLEGIRKMTSDVPHQDQ